MLISESAEAEVWLLKNQHYEHLAVEQPSLPRDELELFKRGHFPEGKPFVWGSKINISATIVDKPTALRPQPGSESRCAFVSGRGGKCLPPFMFQRERGAMERGSLLLTRSRPSSCVPVPFDFSEAIQSHGHFRTASYLR